MPKVVVSKHIDAPAQDVFEVFTNFAAAPARIRGIKRLEVLTEGPVGVGTRFRETRVMFGKEATEEMEITQFDPPHRYVVEADSCGCHYLSEFKFTPEGDGTRVDAEFGGQATTWVAKCFAPLAYLMMGTMRKCIDADIDDLKGVAESQAKSHA